MTTGSGSSTLRQLRTHHVTNCRGGIQRFHLQFRSVDEPLKIGWTPKSLEHSVEAVMSVLCHRERIYKHDVRVVSDVTQRELINGN